jgi:hypothetical protein
VAVNNDTLQLLLDKNPGLLSILFTGVLLPLGILWLTNRHNRKQKESEKSLDIKYNSKEDLRHQKRMIYASLSKILFDLQQLHTSLSDTATDSDSIINAIKRFEVSISKYHGDISNNMLYLSSPVINLIYQFYSQINELKIELRELSLLKETDMARISVFYYSQDMADTLIEVQEVFVRERIDFKVQFDKAEQGMMKKSFGPLPAGAVKEKYEQIKQTLSLS